MASLNIRLRRLDHERLDEDVKALIFAKWRFEKGLPFGQINAEEISDKVESLVSEVAERKVKGKSIIIAECCGGLIGYAIYDTMSEEATHVSDLYVSQFFRANGVGRKIMKAIIKESKIKGKEGIHLVACEDTTGFYERLGFEKFIKNEMYLDFRKV